MNVLIIILIFAPPAITLAYAIGEHLGWWDHLRGRRRAIEGLKRLSTPTGYPESWIFDDEQDATVFRSLEKRISNRTTSAKIRRVLDEGVRPSLIVVAGSPAVISGVPHDWPQEARTFYSENHPVMFAFGAQRGGDTKGKIDQVCTLGELSRWLDQEKDNRKFLIGTLAIGLFSLALIAIRSTVAQ